MTENGKELEEVRRAHAALERRFDAVIPTLATKADLDATARQLGRRLEELQTKMAEGFTRLAMWMAGTIIAVLIAVVGFLAAVWSRTPPPAVYVYPSPATAPAALPLAPPPQP